MPTRRRRLRPSVPPIPAPPRQKVEGAMSSHSRTIPRWARTLAHGIRARLGNTFVLHGNTHDLAPLPTRCGPRAAIRAADHVPGEWIFGQRDVVIDISAPTARSFHTRDRRTLHRRGGIVDAVHGTDLARSLPREPAVFFSLLDSFLKQVVHRESPPRLLAVDHLFEERIEEREEHRRIARQRAGQVGAMDGVDHRHRIGEMLVRLARVKCRAVARWYSITTSRWPNIQSPRKVVSGAKLAAAPGSVAATAPRRACCRAG